MVMEKAQRGNAGRNSTYTYLSICGTKTPIEQMIAISNKNFLSMPVVRVGLCGSRGWSAGNGSSGDGEVEEEEHDE